MRKLIAASLLLFAVQCKGETLSQLITDSRVLARDAASSTRQRFSDAQVTEFLNQGQREAVSTSRCIVASYQFQLAAGTTYYALPSNFTAITRVTRGKYGAMLELSPAGLDGRSRGWETASGTPTYYFVNFSSRGKVGFATWPAASSDTDTVKVEYYATANDLASSTDIPFNGIGELADYHHALAYYAAGIMGAIDGLPNQSTAFVGIYNGMLATMKSRCLDRPSYLPSASSSP